VIRNVRQNVKERSRPGVTFEATRRGHHVGLHRRVHHVDRVVSRYLVLAQKVRPSKRPGMHLRQVYSSMMFVGGRVVQVVIEMMVVVVQGEGLASLNSRVRVVVRMLLLLVTP